MLLYSCLLSVLQALHTAGWLHRDISGGNVMLWQNKVKIADFEYAKRFKNMKTAEELENTPHHNLRTVCDVLNPTCTELEVLNTNLGNPTVYLHRGRYQRVPV